MMLLKQKNGAQLLVSCLEKHGVKYVFGLPGAKVDAIFDALVDSKIEVILCRHEQNAAFMAAIHGRLTGEPGIVLVTSGPGVSNLATGLLTATTEGDPVIAIGANVPTYMRFKQTHQSLDNAELMRPVTKRSLEILSTESIPEEIENAFRAATEPRSGAVFISIPQDIAQQTTKAVPITPRAPITRGSAPDEVIMQAAELINQAKKPAILLGLNSSRPRYVSAIRKLLTRSPIATVGTYQAAGVVSKELLHCFVGRVGLFHNQPGDKLLNDADVILTIGFNPVEYDTEIWNAKGKAKLIHLNTLPSLIHTTYQPEIEIIGDLEKNIDCLTARLTQSNKIFDEKHIQTLQKELFDIIASGANRHGDRIHPLRFIYELNQFIDNDTTIISDIGTHYMWLARYLLSHEPRHLLFSNGQQTLGVAIPWAISARLIRPDNKIISVSGDGGFLFSSMELETAIRIGAHFVHCVWVDGSYDMVREQQLLKYKRDSAVKFGSIDIVKYAESFGAKGYRVSHSNELHSVLGQALNEDTLALVEIPIDYSDSLEMFKAVHESSGN